MAKLKTGAQTYENYLASVNARNKYYEQGRWTKIEVKPTQSQIDSGKFRIKTTKKGKVTYQKRVGGVSKGGEFTTRNVLTKEQFEFQLKAGRSVKEMVDIQFRNKISTTAKNNKKGVEFMGKDRAKHIAKKYEKLTGEKVSWKDIYWNTHKGKEARKKIDELFEKAKANDGEDGLEDLIQTFYGSH